MGAGEAGPIIGRGDRRFYHQVVDTLLSERPRLCSGGHGERASISKQRNDMNKVIFKAHFSNHRLLNKPGAEEHRKRLLSPSK